MSDISEYFDLFYLFLGIILRVIEDWIFKWGLYIYVWVYGINNCGGKMWRNKLRLKNIFYEWKNFYEVFFVGVVYVNCFSFNDFC